MEWGLNLLGRESLPSLLTEIHDAPKQLYIRGELPSLEHRWLAVVGSRACTSYGEQVTKHLIEGLRGYPVVIVSGLAYGIDALAHRAALDVGLPTIGVPGSGLDWEVLYPKANVRLAKEILEKGGALVSEFEPAKRTMDYMFPQRNRIMAGLCQATLVIEAREKSGSLITAKLATEYNRDLLVVPGNIFSAESAGTHQFLKLGATPITSVNDLLQALELAPREPRELLRADLSDDEMRIIDLLASPVHRDHLLHNLEIPISEANALLSMMEIKGIIVEELGTMRLR